MKRMTLLILGSMLIAPAGSAQEGVRTANNGGASSNSPSNIRIVFAGAVFEELEMLADTLSVETVRCLIGLPRGDSLLVDLAWKPPIHQSTVNSVEYGHCPVATILLWHNHPWTQENEPEYSCYLSRTDMREAMKSWAPPIQMLQVTGGVACWWTRTQVAAQADAPMMRPLPRQSRGRFDLWKDLACEPARGRVVCSRQALNTGPATR